jgi:hypothetical protein
MDHPLLRDDESQLYSTTKAEGAARVIGIGLVQGA